MAQVKKPNVWEEHFAEYYGTDCVYSLYPNKTEHLQTNKKKMFLF